MRRLTFVWSPHQPDRSRDRQRYDRGRADRHPARYVLGGARPPCNRVSYLRVREWGEWIARTSRSRAPFPSPASCEMCSTKRFRPHLAHRWPSGQCGHVQALACAVNAELEACAALCPRRYALAVDGTIVVLAYQSAGAASSNRVFRRGHQVPAHRRIYRSKLPVLHRNSRLLYARCRTCGDCRGSHTPLRPADAPRALGNLFQPNPRASEEWGLMKSKPRAKPPRGCLSLSRGRKRVPGSRRRSPTRRHASSQPSDAPGKPRAVPRATHVSDRRRQTPNAESPGSGSIGAARPKSTNHSNSLVEKARKARCA